MNKIILIGNLTADPQLRTTQAGDAVCSFTIAVNRRKNAQAGQPEADFFRVNVWRQQGENCARYLSKGKKVYVSGPVQCRTYTGQDGQTRASMEVTANEVEFLSPAGNTQQNAPQAAPAPQYNGPQNNGGFVQVDGEELPF
jgi:single-strand DNA-binding protein